MGNWITVDSVVTDYIGEAELSMNQYYKLWNIAFLGMEELGIDFFYEVKTVRIPISPNGTAMLPPHINWIKIGAFTVLGDFVAFGYNKKLTSYASLNPNRKTLNGGGILNELDSFYSISTPVFYNFGGSCLRCAQWYGNQFNVDEKSGVVVFDNWANLSDVAAEIMAAPKAGEEYYIPSAFRMALIEWIGWRDIKHLPNSRRSNISEKRDRKHDFYNARRLAGMRYKPFLIDQDTE